MPLPGIPNAPAMETPEEQREALLTLWEYMAVVRNTYELELAALDARVFELENP